MTDNLPEALRADAEHVEGIDGRHRAAQRMREAADTIEALTAKVEYCPAVTIESLLADTDLTRRVLADGARVVYANDPPEGAAEPSLTMVYSAVMELRAEVKAMAAAVERKSTPIFHITHAEAQAQAVAPDGVKLWSPEDGDEDDEGCANCGEALSVPCPLDGPVCYDKRREASSPFRRPR